MSVEPTDPNIQYLGRWNFSNPSVPWVYWQGSSIRVNFRGTGISLDLEAESNTEEFRVVLDGKAGTNRVYLTGREVKVLAENLPPGTHTLHVVKETWVANRSYFHGLEVAGSGLVAPPPRSGLRIEFLGDSNTDGSSNYSERDSGGMGTYYAFPAMVTRMLGAEMNLEARGGATIGDVGSYLYSEDPRTPDPTYRSGFDPHLIVVNAGANDLGAGKELIKNRYKELIGNLRHVYGEDPHIVLFNAYGWDVEEPAGYIQEVADEVGGRLSACPYPWLWEQWHGCQWDHSGEAHHLMDHLATINPAWVRVAPNDLIDGFGRNFNVANGSFEHRAPFGGFGWRYYLDGVERIHDPEGAQEGEYYIRLQRGESVHQPIDATGDALPGGTTDDQVYYLSAWVRSTTEGSILQVLPDFEGQQLYRRENQVRRSFGVSTSWQRHTTSFTAPNGAWKTFIVFQSRAGTIDIDDVRVSHRPFLTGASVTPATFRLSWQSSSDAQYEIQAADRPDASFWDVLNTVTGDGQVLVKDADLAGQTRRMFRLRTVDVDASP